MELTLIFERAAAQHPQHYGLGKRLVARAERVAWAAGLRRVAIISGVGVRRYYEKLGYSLQGVGQYMIKELSGDSLPPWEDAVSAPRSKDEISEAMLRRECVEQEALHPGGAGAAGRFGEGRRWRRKGRGSGGGGRRCEEAEEGGNEQAYSETRPSRLVWCLPLLPWFPWLEKRKME